MNYKLIMRLLGAVLWYEGLMMLPSLGVALYYGEGDATAFALSIGILLAAGRALRRLTPRNRPMQPREGFAAVAIIWLFISAFGALPFVLSGAIPNCVDALFECASGFTTTGSTLVANVEALPHGILFWRSFTHLLGGMGVLVLAMALMPTMGAGTVYLLKAESPGPTPGKLLPKLGATAKVLYLIYILMTVLLTVLLRLAGMPLFDAAIHAMGTAGTGGFSNRNLSVGAYANPMAEWIIAAFMLLFGINFTLYFYLFVQRDIRRAAKNEEFGLYLVVIGLATGIIALLVWGQHGPVTSLRHAFFQVTSIISTSGFTTVNFDLWPELARCLLLCLMALGACAGSTGGGLKVVRLLLLGKGMFRATGRIIHPRMVRPVKMDGKTLSDEVVHTVLVFTVGFIGLVVLGTLILALDDFDFLTTFSAALTAMGNVGPGLGLVGPMGNFAAFSPLSKLTLALLMIIGRLEIFPVLLLFSRETWRKTA
ncbi:MAG: TrkH family potassium uptake protein [Oscillospiraceae bacterium]|jgi:trk system potassium uptake protein TrkH|nr:TrkH family potassium uptake protein [Oscillospiraceae bacterium]